MGQLVNESTEEINDLKGEIHQLRKIIGDSETETQQLQRSLSHSQIEIQQLQKTITDLETEKNEAQLVQKSLSHSETEMRQLRKTIGDLESETQQLQKILSHSETETQQLRKTITDLETEVQELRSTLSYLDTEKESSKELIREKQKIEEQYNKLEKELKNLSEHSERKIAELELHKNAIATEKDKSIEDSQLLFEEKLKVEQICKNLEKKCEYLEIQLREAKEIKSQSPNLIMPPVQDAKVHQPPVVASQGAGISSKMPRISPISTSASEVTASMLSSSPISSQTTSSSNVLGGEAPIASTSSSKITAPISGSRVAVPSPRAKAVVQDESPTQVDPAAFLAPTLIPSPPPSSSDTSVKKTPKMKDAIGIVTAGLKMKENVRSVDLKKQLMDWQLQFEKEHGRKPTKDDIKNNPSARDILLQVAQK